MSNGNGLFSDDEDTFICVTEILFSKTEAESLLIIKIKLLASWLIMILRAHLPIQNMQQPWESAVAFYLSMSL